MATENPFGNFCKAPFVLESKAVLQIGARESSRSKAANNCSCAQQTALALSLAHQPNPAFVFARTCCRPVINSSLARRVSDNCTSGELSSCADAKDHHQCLFSERARAARLHRNVACAIYAVAPPPPEALCCIHLKTHSFCFTWNKRLLL